MDMECDPAVVDLPLSDPRCVKALECCTEFYAGGSASQAATPFVSQVAYGLYATYFWVVIVGLLAIWHGLSTLQNRLGSSHSQATSPAGPSHSPGPGAIAKVRALARFVFYRSFNIRGARFYFLTLPTTTPVAGLLLIIIVFATALTFMERPYYRPQFGFGSPPIAVRTGLMAFACIPILVALAGKANIISFLTGIGHEKLNLFHQWVAWISFVLSLIHTIPFFIASYYEPGDGGYARVVSEFYRNDCGPLTEYSGVPPLAMLFGLCLFSIPQIRQRFYESFYAAHILMAITYLGLCFWHAGDVEDTWAYLWATLAIWLASWLARLFWFNRTFSARSISWATGSLATLQNLPENMVRIEVERPWDFRFTTAQHCFIRVPSVSLVDNHPFTLIEAPATPPSPGTEEEAAAAPAKILFLAKVHDGFTRKLAIFTAARGGGLIQTSLFLDGPYGGLAQPRLENEYSTMLLIAGGSGISACLAWLLHVACLTRRCRLERATLIWAIRDARSFDWASQELQAAVSFRRGVQISIWVFVTGNGALQAGAESADADSPGSSASPPAHKGDDIELLRESSGSIAARIKELGNLGKGRPNLSAAVHDAAAFGQKTHVFVCGPSGMNVVVANACADAQWLVLQGKSDGIGLHVENFGW